VVERVPVAVWRYADGLRLIDAEAMTGMIGRARRPPDLPLIAGDGAKDAIGEALALFAAAAPIAPACAAGADGASGAGTWCSTPTRGCCCPRRAPCPRSSGVIALHQAQDMLDRDVAVVDMRLGRPADAAGGARAMALMRPSSPRPPPRPRTDPGRNEIPMRRFTRPALMRQIRKAALQGACGGLDWAPPRWPAWCCASTQAAGRARPRAWGDGGQGQVRVIGQG
jgi:hypothetical protein